MTQPSPEKPAPLLTETDRQRIMEEETYRAQARVTVQQQQNKQNAPWYWSGFWLNALVTGLGFLVIGEIIWGIVWFVAAIAIGISTSFIGLPLVWLFCLIHYRSLYMSKYT
ncbi:hypothetical protein [Deinococcus humi]|uniref:Uncharacterized protein n=1 Tax=Deinococcus humi TaxID=662880 RepID=A0A7W8NEU3_9DEIO|nr:hypothetical protein [Deinococcus humi]MBB5361322.1 hypothetical protein [Deinococcus humi]